MGAEDADPDATNSKRGPEMREGPEKRKLPPSSHSTPIPEKSLPLARGF